MEYLSIFMYAKNFILARFKKYIYLKVSFLHIKNKDNFYFEIDHDTFKMFKIKVMNFYHNSI